MFRKLLGSSVSLLFMSFTVIGVLIISLGSLLLDRDFLKAQLEDVGTYQGITEMIIDNIESGQAEHIDTTSQLALNSQEISRLVYAVLPPAWIQSTFEGILDTTLDWFRSNKTELSIVIDLGDQKQKLNDSLEQLLREKGTSLPVCSPAELKNIGVEGPSEISCLPPGLSVDAFLGDSGLGVYTALSEQIPGEIRLDALLQGELVPDSSGNSVMTKLHSVRQGLWWYETGIRLWVVLEIGFLLLMVLLRWRRPRVLLGWIGKMGLAIGFDLGLLGYALSLSVVPYVTSWIDDNVVIDASVRPWLDRVLLLLQNYLNTLGDKLMTIALPLLIAGAVSLLGRWLLGRRHGDVTPKPPTVQSISSQGIEKLPPSQSSDRETGERREIRPAITIKR